MSGYTANLDTYAMSTHGLAFNSMVAHDGQLIGLDDVGLFVLDGADDDGLPIDASLTMGFSDFAEFTQDPGFDAARVKRVRACYLTGLASDRVSVTLTAGDGASQSSSTMQAFYAVSTTPTESRLVPPQGMTARLWKLVLAGSGFWKVIDARLVVETLSRGR